jgi:hypothetical protein
VQNRSAGQPVAEEALPSLFCFAVVRKDSAEPWLIQAQLARGAGIFGCNSHVLYADEPLRLYAPEADRVAEAVVVAAEKPYQAAVPGSSEKVWHNTGVFVATWQLVYQSGEYRKHAWIVKVDPDTVFLPSRLRLELHNRLAPKVVKNYKNFMSYVDPDASMYLVNCRQWYSLQGPLEILSRPAADAFFAGISTCQSGLAWQSWGEDWFVSHCLKFLKVPQHEGFGLLNDMYCGSPYSGTGNTYSQEVQSRGVLCTDGKPAYHAYKTVANVRRCLDQALGDFENWYDPA